MAEASTSNTSGEVSSEQSRPQQQQQQQQPQQQPSQAPSTQIQMQSNIAPPSSPSPPPPFEPPNFKSKKYLLVTILFAQLFWSLIALALLYYKRKTQAQDTLNSNILCSAYQSMCKNSDPLPIVLWSAMINVTVHGMQIYAVLSENYLMVLLCLVYQCTNLVFVFLAAFSKGNYYVILFLFTLWFIGLFSAYLTDLAMIQSEHLRRQIMQMYGLQDHDPHQPIAIVIVPNSTSLANKGFARNASSAASKTSQTATVSQQSNNTTPGQSV